MTPVTDPDLIRRLEGGDQLTPDATKPAQPQSTAPPVGMSPVLDPTILEELNKGAVTPPNTLPLPPNQFGGALRWPAMIGSSLAKGAAQGIGSIGDLQDLLQRGVNIPTDWLARNAFGLAPPPPSSMPGNPLSSERLIGYGKAAGIMERPDLQPQSTGERFATAAAEGAGGVLPFAPLGGGSLVANALRAGTQGAAAGAGGEAAAEIFPNFPILSRLGGNILGAIGGGAAFNAANRLAGVVAGAPNPTMQAYRDLGITPRLAGDVSGGPTAQMLQAYSAKAPGGAGRIRSAAEQTIGQWGTALEDTASNYGTARSLQDAGDALQSSAKNWLSQFRNDSDAAWRNVSVFVPPKTPVSVTNYSAALNDVRSAMPNAQETATVLQPALSKNLLDALGRDTQKGALTFQDVKAIRTRIGEKLADPQLVGDTGYADLKRLYGALSDDMASAVAQAGPQAQQAFDSASALTREGHTFIENVLSRIVKGDKISPERAATAALSSAGAGGTTLNAVRQELPQAADELAAFKLRDMALANAGRQSAEGTRLSPGTFVTDYSKLAPESAQALFGSDPRVGSLATVGDAMKRTEQMLNTSNTAPYQAIRDILMATVPTGAATGLVASGGNPLGGLGGAITGAVAPWLVNYGVARGVTSPAVTALLASRAAALPSAGLYNRAATLPPALRALLAGSAVPQRPNQ